ncbi:MAG: 23S rRNA (adenine(2030)-N(6))-methyltransferase RlmJ [Gammaproteobacteria bacterium]|jgi:23S rRNA (adenine2030-N6)-methyltransferase
MNYRHKYHAGSFADVLKHTVLLALIDALQKKPGAYTLIDTHAGEGCYDLRSEIAHKTGEVAAGIMRLQNDKNPRPETVEQYLKIIESSEYYPGSPMIAANTARAQDVIILNEKHPQTYQQLKQNFKSAKNIAIHARDAYELLPALLPPKTARGLAFIDPAFEDKLEMDHLAKCLQKCHQRWPQGIYLIWLPIVGRTFYTPNDLQHAGFSEYLTIEFTVKSELSETPGLIGSSLLLINPPWQIETTLKPLLAYLWEVLHIDASSGWRID